LPVAKQLENQEDNEGGAQQGDGKVGLPNGEAGKENLPKSFESCGEK
jgi:hypothetical protein